eukprot:scaffold45287_cov67-Phaeocystis_antarctica.AAC.4
MQPTGTLSLCTHGHTSHSSAEPEAHFKGSARLSKPQPRLAVGPQGDGHAVGPGRPGCSAPVLLRAVPSVCSPVAESETAEGLLTRLLEHFEDLPNLLDVELRLECRGRLAVLAEDLHDWRHEGEVLLPTATGGVLLDEALVELAHHAAVLYHEPGLDLPIPRVDARASARVLSAASSCAPRPRRSTGPPSRSSRRPEAAASASASASAPAPAAHEHRPASPRARSLLAKPAGVVGLAAAAPTVGAAAAMLAQQLEPSGASAAARASPWRVACMSAEMRAATAALASA